MGTSYWKKQEQVRKKLRVSNQVSDVFQQYLIHVSQLTGVIAGMEEDDDDAQ